MSTGCERASPLPHLWLSDPSQPHPPRHINESMKRSSLRISDLYRSDLDRHLFAPESRNRRKPRSTSGLADWLRVTAAIIVWALSSGR